MNRNSVFCIASSRTQAEDIVNGLKEANFSDRDISVLFSDKKMATEFANENNTKGTSGDITKGAGTGGVIGGALGWIAGIGALTIPGAGPFVAAGPLMATLSGATAGGIAGGLIGLGISEIEAGWYERKISAGNILISAHPKDAGQIHRAKGIFMGKGAEDICMPGETSTASTHPISSSR